MGHCVSKIVLSAELKYDVWCVCIVIFPQPQKPWEMVYAKEQVKAASAVFCLINTGIPI